jgi:transcriptional regulator with XRE-family HTH domain
MSSLKIIQTLKRDLKAKGITYKDVAAYLKMTEAGVKKLLSKEDISFNKLKLLCDLLQISPNDLLNSLDEFETETHTFTEKQVNFFLNNRHYFHFFMKLAYEQKNPRIIQAEYKLSARSLNSYLKKLEELGLIKRHPFDRTQIVGGIPLAVKTNGTELEFFKYEIAFDQLQIMKEKRSDSLSGAGFFLTDSEKEQFLGKLLGLVIDFSTTSRSNRKKENKLAKEYNFMSFFIGGSMFHKIVEIKN